MSNKVAGYRCSKCGKKIWVPESIIRGMGPICFGQSYSMKRMLKGGMSREEIEKLPKEEIIRLAKKELQRYKKNIRINGGKIKMRKIKPKKDKNQRTLDSFLVPNNEKNNIEKLKEELYSITNSLSKTSGHTQERLSDRVFELMNEIKSIEDDN